MKRFLGAIFSLVLLALGVYGIWCGYTKTIPGFENDVMTFVSAILAYGPFWGLFAILGGLTGLIESVTE